MQIPDSQPTRDLPGSAPQAIDPLGSSQGQRNGPFTGTASMIDLLGRVPRQHDETVQAAGHPVPESVRDLLTAATVAITKAPDVARQHIRAAEQVGIDDRVAIEGKRRLIGESATAAADQLAELQRTAAANIEMARTELHLATLPKLDPGREGYARQDAALRIDSVAPSQRPTLLMELAKGNDDVAALVAGPYGRNVLKSAGLSGQLLEDAHKGIIAAATSSASDSTDPARRAAAAHLATLDKLAGNADMIGVLARKSRSEILARHGLPDQSAIRATAAAMRRP